MQNMGGPPPFRRPPEGGPIRNVPPMTPPSGMGPEGPQQFSGRDMPRTAPPNFIPEMPAGERMFAPEGQGPEERNQFGGMRRFPGRPGQDRFERDEFNRRRRGLRGCVGRFTYIWLFNGDEFWFFPIDVNDMFVTGFRWRRNRWVFDRIFIRRIIFFRCF